jgi:hypothetical protein
MEFPPKYYPDGYLPVKTILGLSAMDLKSIMDENDEDQNYLPPHLIKLKRNNPNQPIDTDMPPQYRIVEAIKFLKEQKLPGSLLGMWQFPLPEIEVFRSPMMFSAALRPRSRRASEAKPADL